MAEEEVPHRQAVLAMILVEELRFELGHVYVGGTLGLARLAFEAEVESGVHAGIGEPVRPSWPVIASRSALRGRGCCPSPPAWPGTSR